MDTEMDLDEGPYDDAGLKPHHQQEVTRLWRTWKTVHEMLVDRGYQISKSELDISRKRFYNKYSERQYGLIDRTQLKMTALPSPEMIAKLTPLPTKKNPTPATTAGQIWVEFCKDVTVGIKHTRAFAHYLSQNNHSAGIFITIGPVTTSALKAFDGLAAATADNATTSISAEHFREEDLLVNITKHELVPTHMLLSDDEKQTLLKRYRLKETQLPRMQSTDPVAKYLGLKKGQVVKIIRKSETAGRYASYRWVF